MTTIATCAAIWLCLSALQVVGVYAWGKREQR